MSQFDNIEIDLGFERTEEMTQSSVDGLMNFGNLESGEMINGLQRGYAPTIDTSGIVLDPSYFSIEGMKQYWDTIFKDEVIAEDETIRIVYFVVDPNQAELAEKAKKLGKKEFKIEGTYKGQINSFDGQKGLISVIKDLQARNPGKFLGISIGAGIFKFDPSSDNGPSYSNFDRTRTMVLDIDCYYHASKSQKDKMNFNSFDYVDIQFVAIQTFNHISQLIANKSGPAFLPEKVYCTGGGFQFHIGFEEALNKQEAESIFKMYKSILASDRLPVTGIINSLVIGFSIQEFYIDIDTTFADVTHVQRLGGMKNQKYMFDVLDISDIFGLNLGKHYKLKDESKRHLFNVRTLSLTDIYETIQEQICSQDSTKGSVKASIFNSNKTSDEKKFYYSKIDTILNNFSIFTKTSFGIIFLKQDFLVLPQIVIKGNDIMHEATRVTDASINDILFKINGNIAINILRNELDFAQELGNIIRVNCPFHEERNASFAIYKNENSKVVMKDFHDDTTYNMISFWMKYKEVDKNTAINQLVSLSGITFSGKESKSLQKAIEGSNVEDLIKEIDTKNFIYYRLATKQKSCLVRHINSGEAFMFDGSKLLAEHVLNNQLKQKDLDPEFRAIFHEKFCEHILIDAFEEFSPGAPAYFSREFIQFVNLWIPGENYKNVHKLADQFEEMDIDSALSLIKTKTPWMYVYMLQITQKGNLKYFMNWLAAASQFRIMPIMPVMTSTYGTGKNLFVDEVLNFYFNNEYVNVMNSDRVQSQFNSQLESCSMLVLDEGDFSKSKEVDNLKFLTGNNTLMVERKGVDTVKRKKQFNTILLTNGESPIHHPVGERRFTYYRLDVTLLQTCTMLGTSIDKFINDIRKEMTDFWAIVTKIKTNPDWSFQNDKSPQFYKQIMLMHPFGRMILKALDNEWMDLNLQLNESVDDALTQSNNNNLIKDLQSQFENNGKISLILINKYMKSLNYKHFQNIQTFINVNSLKEFGFEITSDNGQLNVTLDIVKIRNSIHMKNNLEEIIPDFFVDKDSKHEAIKTKENKSLKNSKSVNNLANANSSNNPNISTAMPNVGSVNLNNITEEEKQAYFDPSGGANEIIQPFKNNHGMPNLPGMG
jgi:hypothetical protein